MTEFVTKLFKSNVEDFSPVLSRFRRGMTTETEGLNLEMPEQSAELDETIYEQIQLLSVQGDEFAENEEYSRALDNYWQAWDLLPEPKTNWDAATWLLSAIGDANFLGNDFAAGRDNLTMALHCPDAIGNPFIHLRLGQCQLELGNLERASDELSRAYMGAGLEIFEDEDPKYFEFISSKMELEQ